DRVALRPGLFLAAQPFAGLARNLDRREKAEVYVHRLKARALGEMPARDMREQRAQRRRLRRRREFPAKSGRGGETAGEQPDRRRFHIALHAGHLAGEADIGPRSEAKLPVEQARAVDEGVAVKTAETREFGVL